MKKIIFQILLILLIMMIGIASVFITVVNAASIAGINCPSSVIVGENFSVSLILPSNAYAAESTVTVKFSNGTTSSARLVYYSGMNDFPNRVTFNAKVEGSATVTCSSIIISDSAGNSVESGGSKSQTLNIVSNNPVQTPPQEPTTPNTPSTSDTSNQVSFTDVNETVYATTNCNIRQSYSTSSTRLGQVAQGTALKRTGVGNNGWSRVEYNGQTAYISSQYVTTTTPAKEEVKFTEVNETMYATQSCNLRESWSTDSAKVGYLTEGQEVTRVGTADNGWSKIKYNGKEVYVATRLLTKEKPEETDEDANIVNNSMANEIAEENQTDLEIIQSEVGVIPDVGNNIAEKIYFIITVIAIALACTGIYYIKINKIDKDV